MALSPLLIPLFHKLSLPSLPLQVAAFAVRQTPLKITEKECRRTWRLHSSDNTTRKERSFGDKRSKKIKMDYSNNKITELNDDGVNYNPWQRKNRLTTQFSYEETDESLQIRRSWEGVGNTNASYEFSDEDHRSLLNLQRLSVEKRRTPFPDFQFELLYNDADTDGSGCELNIATGARKRLTSRGDSLEDNWLFQKRDLKQRPSDTIDFSLALSKNYETAEELTDTEVDDLPRDKTDKSESSEEDEWNKVRRVERPSVHTSSSASVDSESISSDSPAENNDSPENDLDDEVPILEDNNSMNESPDPGESRVQDAVGYGVNDSEDEECASEKCGDERDGSDSSPPLVRRKDLEEFHRRLMKNNGADSMSDDDSLKNEVLKHAGERASTSRPVNPLLPMLLARRTPSSCGTRSCDSDDSSSDDFE
ncbi:hypothetical protein J437_LFUL016735 [Ladona fulva]|uniref:Uncharacterized protein n=1 Tax=Ladona fulva TaxID=123851 RepID=A0A8K0P9G9_LADFU|nr:hypothetical protein J437_LFUL016735 [Ladona fulva]